MQRQTKKSILSIRTNVGIMVLMVPVFTKNLRLKKEQSGEMDSVRLISEEKGRLVRDDSCLEVR